MDDTPKMQMIKTEEMTVLETIAARANNSGAKLPWTYHTLAGISVTFNKGE